MQLPIATVSSDDVMRAARRCRMDLSRALAEEFSADGVFAFSSTYLPTLPAANCVELNALLTEGQFERITADFAARSARCLRWTGPQIDQRLIDRGARVRQIAVMRLTCWSRATDASTAMVLQARAAMPKMEQLLAKRFGIDAAAILAGLSHVDDPQDEWLIAMQDGQAIAMAGVLTSGDAGLVHDVFSLSGESAAAHQLLDRVLEVAARAGLKHVVACAGLEELAVYESAGFVEIGRLVEHLLL